MKNLWENLKTTETLWSHGANFYISFARSYGRKPAETALITPTNLSISERTFYILIGDFRSEYDKAWPNWNKCRHVFNSRSFGFHGKILLPHKSGLLEQIQWQSLKLKK